MSPFGARALPRLINRLPIDSLISLRGHETRFDGRETHLRRGGSARVSDDVLEFRGATTNPHASSVDDALLHLVPVPGPVLGVGRLIRALLGRSCLAKRRSRRPPVPEAGR